MAMIESKPSHHSYPSRVGENEADLYISPKVMNEQIWDPQIVDTPDGRMVWLCPDDEATQFQIDSMQIALEHALYRRSKKRQKTPTYKFDKRIHLRYLKPETNEYMTIKMSKEQLISVWRVLEAAFLNNPDTYPVSFSQGN